MKGVEMCQSQANGGQRCHSHAKPAYAKAVTEARAAEEAAEAAGRVCDDLDEPYMLGIGPKSAPEVKKAAVKALRQAENDMYAALDRMHQAEFALASTPKGYKEAMAKADAIEAESAGKSPVLRRSAIERAENVRAMAKAASGTRTLRDRVRAAVNKTAHEKYEQRLQSIIDEVDKPGDYGQGLDYGR